jgi:hypothetical protein
MAFRKCEYGAIVRSPGYAVSELARGLWRFSYRICCGRAPVPDAGAGRRRLKRHSRTAGVMGLRASPGARWARTDLVSGRGNWFAWFAVVVLGIVLTRAGFLFVRSPAIQSALIRARRKRSR